MPFIFTTSQVGAEPIIREEVSRQFPDARPAFSRPGLLTFKLPDAVEEGFRLRSVFARTWGFSLGTVRGADTDAMIDQLWTLAGEREFHRVHVWGRDLHRIGDYKFEPRLTDEAHDLCWRIGQRCPTDTLFRLGQGTPADKGDCVLDCVLVNPKPPTMTAEFLARRDLERGYTEAPGPAPVQEWLVGWHRVDRFASMFPGGMLELEVPVDVVSRAWLKMEEALRWSHFPMRDGARVCEIGSSPGGATQALLSRGCEVLGIDPAEMHPSVLADPRFRHIRSRIAFVKRREFRKIRWLACDMNVPPNYTLDVVESVVMHPEVNVRGMLLTLKFTDWNMGLEVADFVARIKSWGFNLVRARQMHTSHQEICVACLKKPFRK